MPSNSFRKNMKVIDYEELKAIARQSARILRQQGKNITRESLLEIIMLMTEWTSYEELDKCLNTVLQEIRDDYEKEAYKQALEYAREIEELSKDTQDSNGEKLRQALRDRFLESYVIERKKRIQIDDGEGNYRSETVSEKMIDPIQFDKNKDKIISAIEYVLKQKGITVKDVIAGWENKIREEHKRDKNYSEKTLMDMVKDHEYSGPYGEAEWAIDCKYIMPAIRCVADPHIDRAYIPENGNIRELEHLI